MRTWLCLIVTIEIWNRNEVLSLLTNRSVTTISRYSLSCNDANSTILRAPLLLVASTSKSSGIDEEFLAFPNREYDGPGVVKECMNALLTNSEPFSNAGLEVCFNFSTDTCRAALGGSLEAFILYADNPTFGSMIDAEDWEVISTGPIIQGTKTRGAMQTQLIDVTPMKGRKRRFLWTLKQERRPPRQEYWLIHEVIFVENAYALTM